MARDPNEKVWLMVFVGIVAVGIAAVVFFLSRQQEWCCGVHKRRKDRKHEDDDVLAEMNDPEKALKVPTKTFVDSQRIGRMDHKDIGDVVVESTRIAAAVKASTTSTTAPSPSEQPASSSQTSNETGDTTLSDEKQQEKILAIMASAPRCVLCSTQFTIGEDVTHSPHNPNCCHEFHELCLRKYWQNNKAMAGKCPICKEDYIVESLAPSMHFSVRGMTTSSTRFAANAASPASFSTRPTIDPVITEDSNEITAADADADADADAEKEQP